MWKTRVQGLTSIMYEGFIRDDDCCNKIQTFWSGLLILGHLKVAAVPPDGTIVDKDLSALRDEVAAEREVSGREVGHVE